MITNNYFLCHLLYVYNFTFFLGRGRVASYARFNDNPVSLRSQKSLTSYVFIIHALQRMEVIKNIQYINSGLGCKKIKIIKLLAGCCSGF